jgi:hypothetical protein
LAALFVSALLEVLEQLQEAGWHGLLRNVIVHSAKLPTDMVL